MKKLLLIIAASLIASIASAQILKLEEVKQLKKSKAIIGLVEDENLNTHLRESIKDYWSFCEITEEMPFKDALKKAKENDNLYVISVQSMTSRSLKHGNGPVQYRTIANGYYVGVFDGGKRAKIMNFIPGFGGNIQKEMIVFGLDAIEYLCNTMIEDNLGTNMKFKQGYKKHSGELKDKKLYVLEGWIGGKKVNTGNLGTYYQYPIKAVNYEAWSAAILEKKEGIAYSIVVPMAVGGKYTYCHYLMEAATGKVFAMSYPKAAASVNGINVSKANTGYINDKNLKMYNEAVHGKW